MGRCYPAGMQASSWKGCGNYENKEKGVTPIFHDNKEKGVTPIFQNSGK
jgi:hypothetical protein